MIQIELEEMTFYAYHGVLEQERRVGNTFEVSLTAEVDTLPSLYSDALEDTLSYADIYAVVEREMREPSALLEHVAGRIVKSLYDEFPRITHLKLRISKHKPPIMGDLTAAAIILDLSRSDIKHTPSPRPTDINHHNPNYEEKA